jgi:hypothetical protein
LERVSKSLAGDDLQVVPRVAEVAAPDENSPRSARLAADSSDEPPRASSVSSARVRR